MSSVAEEMVPKAVVDILVQQVSTLQATVDRLTATIEEKDRIIAEKIEIIMNQNRTRFGQSSEKRTYLVSDGQLSLFEQAGDGITEKAAEKDESAEKQEVTVSAHKRKPKRTMEELCANLPEEEILVDLPEQEKFTADGRPMKCIGTDEVRTELVRGPGRKQKPGRQRSDGRVFRHRCCREVMLPLPSSQISSSRSMPTRCRCIGRNRYGSGWALTSNATPWPAG